MSHTNAILQNIPVASTATGAFEIAVLRIHGKGRPTVTSKILLPEFEIFFIVFKNGQSLADFTERPYKILLTN